MVITFYQTGPNGLFIFLSVQFDFTIGEKILTKKDCLKELVHEIQFQKENNNGSIINFADQYLKKNYNYSKEEL